MALGDDQAHFLSALQGVTGPEFDTTYAKQQVLAHRAALATEQMYAASGDDPNLRKVATSAVPLIEAHAAMAKKMADKFGGA
jgi:putative membrane protein